ncbi:MAG: YerC/YecD family TrpR-related protein [Cloacibacillus sp.]
MSSQWKDEYTDQLCDCIVAITDRDEAYRFLEDVATFSEIKAFSQRLQVAHLLLKGLSYPQIVQATGASTATISRVKKFVEYGADGYRDVLKKLEMQQPLAAEPKAEPKKKRAQQTEN